MPILFTQDPCAPPVTIPPSLHDHLITMLLRQTIPYLEYIEHGTRTNAELRNLIKQAKAATGD
jgi:hypothetical protein